MGRGGAGGGRGQGGWGLGAQGSAHRRDQGGGGALRTRLDKECGAWKQLILYNKYKKRFVYPWNQKNLITFKKDSAEALLNLYIFKLLQIL